MAKDFRNIEYHTNQDGDGVRYYACSTLNTKRKEIIFHKNKGAIVEIRWEVNVYKDIKKLSETFAKWKNKGHVKFNAYAGFNFDFLLTSHTWFSNLYSFPWLFSTNGKI